MNSKKNLIVLQLEEHMFLEKEIYSKNLLLDYFVGLMSAKDIKILTIGFENLKKCYFDIVVSNIPKLLRREGRA